MRNILGKVRGAFGVLERYGAACEFHAFEKRFKIDIFFFLQVEDDTVSAAFLEVFDGCFVGVCFLLSTTTSA